MFDEKIGFELGWDYYSFGLLLPNYLKGSGFDLLLKGYQAARRRVVRQSQDDRFVRKWLLLRGNAWRRNRVFDPAVTPAFIRHIDTPICPITELTLTHGQGLPSDWSVDRLNNNSGYSPGNLVIVSSLANVAKNNLSYPAIRSLACSTADDELPPGHCGMRPLTLFEWQRWAAICSHVVTFDDMPGHLGFDVMPCVTRIPRNIPMNSASGLQLAISLFVSEVDCAPLNAVLAALPKLRRRALREVLSRAQKCSGARYGLYGLWLNPRLFTEFCAFYESLSDQEELLARNAIVRTLCRLRRMEIDPDNWATESAGYIPKAISPADRAALIASAIIDARADAEIELA